MRITRKQLRKIIKEAYEGEYYGRAGSEHGHGNLMRMQRDQIDHEDKELGHPGSKNSRAWHRFNDMSDKAEAYDWLDRAEITDRRLRDELVELWEDEASSLEYEELYQLLSRG